MKDITPHITRTSNYLEQGLKMTNIGRNILFITDITEVY
jgi:hypothetical protein